MSKQEKTLEDIKKDLHQAFHIEDLVVIDESSKHSGHYSSTLLQEGGAVSHLKIRLISNDFKGFNLLQRHRMVYQVLQAYFPSGLHALSMKLLTTEEAPHELR